MFETQRDAEKLREAQREAERGRTTDGEHAKSNHRTSVLLAAVPLDALDLNKLHLGDKNTVHSVRCTKQL